MNRLVLPLSLFAAFALSLAAPAARLPAIGVILGMFACKKETATTAADETRKEREPAKKEEAKKEEAKEEAKKEGGGGKIGVAECDEYLDKYEKCVGNKVPASARGVMKTGMSQTRDTWKTAAATAEGKVALAAACKTAMEAAKKGLAAFNCEW